MPPGRLPAGCSADTGRFSACGWRRRPPNRVSARRPCDRSASTAPARLREVSSGGRDWATGGWRIGRRTTDDGPAGADVDTVVVLDFGSQYSRLIARRVRELNVYSELLPFDTPWTEIAARKPGAVILSGGPASVYEDGSPHPDPAIWTGGVPILGICYGLHLMAQGLGGEVVSFSRKEFGPAAVSVAPEDPLFAGLEPEQSVWMSHGDSIRRLPDGFRSTARTDSTPYAAVADPARAHVRASSSTPRSSTPRRAERSCATSSSASPGPARPGPPANFIARPWRRSGGASTSTAARPARTASVLCALSGGVDSAVAATLVHRAVGDRLTCVHVDHGLMRKNETELLQTAFEQLGVKVIVVDARERFLRKLEGVIDPEQKRRIIGAEFIRVFEEEAAKLGRDRLPDPGHALPGRHRIGDLGQGEGGRQDQDPPQRRRPARRPALPAHRAAAVPVQGRGSGRRHGAGPARLDGPAPAVPRARAWRSGSSARSPPSGSTPCARPTGSSSTRSRPRACTAASGSRSPS